MSGDSKLSCPELSSEGAIKWAAENGVTVRIPEANQLFLDIDDEYGRDTFEKNRDIIDTVYGIENITSTPSRSGKRGRCHMVVNLKTNINPITRIAIQAVLGSDRRREAHSLRRVMAIDLNPTLFFEKEAS